MQFAISTHLYHESRLDRGHLVEVAGHGFEAIELFATRSHFDYHDPSAADRLGEWLSETGLSLHGIHAPIGERFAGGRWSGVFSNAAIDPAIRHRALDETRAALTIAQRVPVRVLVTHLGVVGGGPADNGREQARRSLEAIVGDAEALGVRVAVEVIPNALSEPPALARMLEDEVELPSAGICLDFGHAFLLGDPVDALEIVGDHLITTHVHDNHGRTDDHLMPYDGGIDWAAALMMMQKVGYQGPLVFEIGNSGRTSEVLAQARRVRERFERALRG